jgi:hypothetical protein
MNCEKIFAKFNINTMTQQQQTRKIEIRSGIFAGEDLRRIGKIFDRQSELANKSQHHSSVEYVIVFADNTTISSDSVEILEDSSLDAPARPVEVKMTFYNHKLGRYLGFAISHGNSKWGNLIVVKGSEPGWIAENFLKFQAELGKIKPQDNWIIRHPDILLHSLALGIGSLGVLIIQVVVNALLSLNGGLVGLHPLPPDSQWRIIIKATEPAFYVLGWAFRLMVGFAWGAFSFRSWILELWPSVEFQFGLPHLRSEEAKRKRLWAMFCLVILPILITVGHDLFKSFLSR